MGRGAVGERLRQVAIELFARHGYPNVSVQQIASTVGVSARTFHRYFLSKQDVILQTGADIDQVIIARIAQLGPVERPVRAIRDVYINLTNETIDLAPFRLWARAVETAPDVMARSVEESRRRVVPALARVFADWLGVDEALDPRPQAMAAAVLAVNFVAIERYIRFDGAEDLVEIYKTSFAFLERSLDRQRELERRRTATLRAKRRRSQAPPSG
jgi:AcrR family transcriptional regulator